MGGIIPSFRDLDTTKDLYNAFLEKMCVSDIGVDLPYDQWCDLYEINGCVEDIKTLYVVPNDKSKWISAENAIVVDKDEMKFLLDIGSISEEFEPFIEPTLKERYREINITTDKGHLIDDYYEQYGDNGDD